MSNDSRELDDLQQTARDVFTRLASSEAVHRLIDAAPRRDTALEQQLRDLGFYDVVLAGGTLAHVLRVVTEGGAAMATTRLLGHAVGVGTALAQAPDSPLRDELIARFAEGATGAVAGLSEATPAFRYRTERDGYVLDGAESFVPDVDDSDLVLIWAEGAGGPTVAVVPTTALRVTTLKTIDRTRVLGSVEIAAADVSPDRVLAQGQAAVDLRRSVRTALELALAHDSAGIARRALALTVDYTRTREQFGRPIGTFQAVQHQAADMAARTELALSTCRGALRDLLAGDAAAPRAALLARNVATTNASWVAGRAIQLHGGIGYTWEHDAHILLKRAKLNECLVTTATERRAELLVSLAHPKPLATGDAA